MSARQGYIDNFVDLENWFMDANVPKFTLAHGDLSSRRYIYTQDDPGVEVEEAWEMLREKLAMFAKNGGTFTVKLPTKNGGNGWTTLFKLPRTENAGMNGLGGGAYVGGNVEAYIAEKISDKLENFELRRKVEDLEAEMANQGSLLERIVNRITEHPNFDPTALADKLLNAVAGIVGAMGAKKGPSVSMSGFPGDAQAAATAAATDETEMSERLSIALGRIAQTFPDINLAELLEGLALYVEKNPEMARMLLINQILKK